MHFCFTILIALTVIYVVEFSSSFLYEQQKSIFCVFVLFSKQEVKGNLQLVKMNALSVGKKVTGKKWQQKMYEILQV